MESTLERLKAAKSEQEIRKIINYTNWCGCSGKFRRSFLRVAKQRRKDLNAATV